MNANGLRIGNKILFENEIVEITAISSTGVSFFNNTDKCTWVLSYKDFDPIPLTPERLDKIEELHMSELEDGSISSQFDNIRTISKTENAEFAYYLDYANNEVEIAVSLWEYSDYAGSAIIAHPKYLHELQNIIHALTGKELTFKQALKQ